MVELDVAGACDAVFWFAFPEKGFVKNVDGIFSFGVLTACVKEGLFVGIAVLE